MNDESCTCLNNVKSMVVAEMRGHGQPQCEAHPRSDDGEHQVAVIPLNGRRELRDQMLTDLTGKDTA